MLNFLEKVKINKPTQRSYGYGLCRFKVGNISYPLEKSVFVELCSLYVSHMSKFTKTIEDLLENAMFTGHHDFKRVMARNRFERIRGSLNLKVALWTLQRSFEKIQQISSSSCL